MALHKKILISYASHCFFLSMIFSIYRYFNCKIRQKIFLLQLSLGVIIGCIDEEMELNTTSFVCPVVRQL